MVPNHVFGAGGMDTTLMEGPLYSGTGKTLLQMCTDVQAIPGISTMEEAAAASSRTPCQANEPHHSYLTFQIDHLVRVQLVAIYTFGLYAPPSPPVPSRPPPSLSPHPPPNPPPKPLYSPPAWGDYGSDAKLCVRGAKCKLYQTPQTYTGDLPGKYAYTPGECARNIQTIVTSSSHSLKNSVAFPIAFASEAHMLWNPGLYDPITDFTTAQPLWCLPGHPAGCVLELDPDYNVFTHTSRECEVLQWCSQRRGDDTCTINNVNQARNGLCKFLLLRTTRPRL